MGLEGFSRWWALVPISLFFLWLVMQANYEKFRNVELQLEHANDETRQKETRIKYLESCLPSLNPITKENFNSEWEELVIHRQLD